MNEKPAYMNNDIEIAINNVSVVFKDNSGNNVQALDNIDFDIHKGEFISLLGPLRLRKNNTFAYNRGFARTHIGQRKSKR